MGASTAALAVVFALAGAVAPLTPQSGLELYARPQTLVALDGGRRMNLYCTGQGSPTVILEGGWTATTVSWRKVQPALSATNRVCSYDRAGFGFSEAGPLPRTAEADAEDLARLLKAAKIKGPYVLVAHSLGGLVARLFVDRHRREVAGVVLVDPSGEYQDREMARVSPAAAKGEAAFRAGFKTCAEAVIAGKMTSDLPERSYCIDPPNPALPAADNAARLAWESTAAYQTTALSEVEALGAASSDEVVKSRRSWGDLPLIVLTAENTQKDPQLSEADQEATGKVWWDLHERVAHLSTRGENRLVRDSGHLIPSERPEAVIQAVTEVIAQARAGSKAAK